MKYQYLSLLLVCPIFLVFSACQSNIAPQSLPAITNLPLQQTQPTNAPSATPDRKTEIVAQIKQIAFDYNQSIEDEKKTGNVQIDPLPNGAKGYTFFGASYPKVVNESLKVYKEIDQLNNEYYQIYTKDKGPIPTVTPLSKDEQRARLSRLMAEYQAWLKNEEKTGTIVMLYNLSYYAPVFIGESYAKGQEMSDEIVSIKLSLNNISDELKRLDIQKIQSIESGNVALIDVGSFPYYRSDIDLTTYETLTTTYNIYSQTHQIIEIIPRQMPEAVAATSISDLEKTAREMIAKFSPDVNLDNLTPAGGAKQGTYFFRWEDRTKPLLDDGKSYPFVQIGLNGNGGLLNYYNTLPLAR